MSYPIGADDFDEFFTNFSQDSSKQNQLGGNHDFDEILLNSSRQNQHSRNDAKQNSFTEFTSTC